MEVDTEEEVSIVDDEDEDDQVKEMDAEMRAKREEYVANLIDVHLIIIDSKAEKFGEDVQCLICCRARDLYIKMPICIHWSCRDCAIACLSTLGTCPFCRDSVLDWLNKEQKKLEEKEED